MLVGSFRFLDLSISLGIKMVVPFLQQVVNIFRSGMHFAMTIVLVIEEQLIYLRRPDLCCTSCLHDLGTRSMSTLEMNLSASQGVGNLRISCTLVSTSKSIGDFIPMKMGVVENSLPFAEANMIRF